MKTILRIIATYLMLLLWIENGFGQPNLQLKNPELENKFLVKIQLNDNVLLCNMPSNCPAKSIVTLLDGSSIQTNLGYAKTPFYIYCGEPESFEIFCNDGRTSGEVYYTKDRLEWNLSFFEGGSGYCGDGYLYGEYKIAYVLTVSAPVNITNIQFVGTTANYACPDASIRINLNESTSPYSYGRGMWLQCSNDGDTWYDVLPFFKDLEAYYYYHYDYYADKDINDCYIDYYDLKKFIEFTYLELKTSGINPSREMYFRTVKQLLL